MKRKLLQVASTGTPAVFRMAGKDAQLDRHGDRMLPGALHLPEGATDIPLYWEHGHQAGKFPVGRAKVWQENGEWFMSPQFSDATDEAKQCAALVADGTLRACSIGYLTEAATRNTDGGEDVSAAELVEVSIVGIPAKPEAVRVAHANNVRTKSMTPEELQAMFMQMAADIAAIKAQLAAQAQQLTELSQDVDAILELAQEDAAEDEAEDSAGAPAAKSVEGDPNMDHGDAPPAEDVVAKFWGRFAKK